MLFSALSTMVDENFEFERKAKGYCLDLTNNVVTDATLEYKKKKKKLVVYV